VREPSPARPALVIIIDEYAELADDAPEATVGGLGDAARPGDCCDAGLRGFR